MQPPSRSLRRRLVLPSVGAVAVSGLLMLPAQPPASAISMPGGPVPGIAILACNLAGELEAAIGDRFGGIWLDVATQHLRVGLLDPADEPAARAIVEACDAKGAASGPSHLPPSAPNTVYVVVPTSYPALRRAQQALSDWSSGPSGVHGRPTIVGHGVRMATDRPGMVLHLTLHTDITDDDVALVEAAVASIAAQHGVPFEIADQRTGYPVTLVDLPGPPPPPLPGPPVGDPPATPPAPTHPSILSRSTASRRLTLSTRQLPLRLSVANAGAVRVTVRTADRRRTVIARGTATPKDAGRLTVRTNLTKAGRAKLRKARRTAVTVTVKQTGQKAVTKRIVVR